jgi:tRNA(Ile)-lysidine synthase
VIAWSGGLDSTVLLHCLVTHADSTLRVRAVHVDHGLQAAAARFRRFCQRMARSWHVPLRVVRVNVPAERGASLEEAARKARRAALEEALAPGEVLLTAQHADDQLETLLLALMRGAGPKGLAGMPARLPLAGACLLRPLLESDRAAITAYAHANALEWEEDPTNATIRFDRNYLRTQVLPVLQARWPAVAHTVSRSARHCASAAALLEAAAASDLAAAADGAGLALTVLRRFTPPRRAAVLRAWIVESGARAPNERHLRQIEAMMSARRDAHPRLHLPDCTVRRIAGRLLLER